MGKGKIFFIAPKFAGYENELIEAMQNNGYEVDFFPEKLHGKVSLFINKINKKLYEKLQKNYLKKILESTKDKSYDFLFVIRGELLSEVFLETLYKQTNIKRRINYQWDSVKRNQILLKTKYLYDKVYSFDKKDCDEYNFSYKPLFFIEKYKKKSDISYDLLFIGTEHGERIKYINRYKTICKENNLKFKIILYTSYLSYFKNKIFSDTFNQITLSDVIFKKISIKESYNFISSSKVVLDVANLHQTGLTMRTVETIGSHRKLITNNEYIKFDNFFNDKNIYDIDKEVDIDFFQSKFTETNIDKLEINEWVNEFFKAV